MGKYASCLRDLPMFAGVDGAAFRSVCLSSLRRRFTKGSYLFRQEEPIDTVFLIKAGRVKLVSTSGGGREVISTIVGPGDLLNETALFADANCGFDAIAIEDTYACCYRRDQFETLVSENAQLAVQVIRYLALKLHERDQERSDDVGASVRDRVVRSLLNLAEEHGVQRPEGTLIDFPLTQSDIAAIVGASRVKVSQVIKDLKVANLLVVQGRRYLMKIDRCLLQNFGLAPK